MIDIIGKKKWFFLLSLIVIVPGLISLLLWGLNPSIDFVGGSSIILDYKIPISDQTKQLISKTISSEKVEVSTIQVSGNEAVIRTALMDTKTHQLIINKLHSVTGSFSEGTFETIGPVISAEITRNAILAVLLASVLIVLFIAYAFRKVPKPASSWRFGVSAIAALLHDVLVLLGIFSILGHFFHVEVDSLFVTAVLTVIGFSVHDTIVVFDRIRENLRRLGGGSFSNVVNASILQTLSRSLNTSLTVILVLIGLLLFGGQSTRWFIVALLIGVISGTYSSIFNAAPLLVLWQEWSERRSQKKNK
jgi:preprotein translocase subunit SecF